MANLPYHRQVAQWRREGDGLWFLAPIRGGIQVRVVAMRVTAEVANQVRMEARP